MHPFLVVLQGGDHTRMGMRAPKACPRALRAAEARLVSRSTYTSGETHADLGAATVLREEGSGSATKRTRSREGAWTDERSGVGGIDRDGPEEGINFLDTSCGQQLKWTSLGWQC